MLFISILTCSLAASIYPHKILNPDVKIVDSQKLHLGKSIRESWVLRVYFLTQFSRHFTMSNKEVDVPDDGREQQATELLALYT